MHLSLRFMPYGILFYLENTLQLVKIMRTFYKLRNDDELIKLVCVHSGFRSPPKSVDTIEQMTDLNGD